MAGPDLTPLISVRNANADRRQQSLELGMNAYFAARRDRRDEKRETREATAQTNADIRAGRQEMRAGKADERAEDENARQGQLHTFKMAEFRRVQNARKGLENRTMGEIDLDELTVVEFEVMADILQAHTKAQEERTKRINRLVGYSLVNGGDSPTVYEVTESERAVLGLPAYPQTTIDYRTPGINPNVSK